MAILLYSWSDIWYRWTFLNWYKSFYDNGGIHLTRLAKRTAIVLVAIILLAQIPMLKTTFARGATMIYVNIKYPERSFQYRDFIYESHFGSYLISYADQNEQLITLTLEPKFLPVIVTYDPLDQPMKD